jgi:hypothetical protein
VSDLRDEMNGDLAAQRTSAAADLAEARRQARTDLRLVKKHALSAQARAVAKAVAAAEQAAPVVQQSTGNTSPNTDPRFSYCYEANDAGYGNYVSGEDPEYAWYDDADGDGVVCEF